MSFEVKFPDSMVTGGTGFIGRWLLVELTRRRRRTAVMMRQADQRSGELAEWVSCHHGDASLLVFVESDLTGDLGLDDPRLVQVRDVFHLGARFELGLDIDTALAANLDPTLALVEWAASLTSIRRFILATGYRSQGAHWTSVADDPSEHAYTTSLAEHGAYEVSKVRADIEARSRADEIGLPVTCVHPGVVIGHSTSGETSQYIGFGELVQQLWSGTLTVLPTTDDTWLPLIPVDWVASFIAQIPVLPETKQGSYSLLDANTPKFPALVDQIARHLGVSAPRRRVRPDLLRQLPSRVTGVTREQLSFISSDDYAMSATVEIASKMTLPHYDLDLSVQRWLDHLVSTGFGRLEQRAIPQTGTVRLVDAAGLRTVVTSVDDDPDVVFFPPLPLTGASTSQLTKTLNYTTLTIDHPGVGRSQSGAISDAWTDAILDSTDRPVIVGSSLGSATALRYAARNPDRVSSLVLISPYFLQPRASWLRRLLHAGPMIRRQTVETLSKSLLHGSGTDESRAVVSAAVDNLRRKGVAGDVAAMLRRVAQLNHRAELSALLAGVKVPTTIVHGSQDGELDQAVLEDRPDIAIITVDAAGHYPELDAPGDVADVVASIIGR